MNVGGHEQKRLEAKETCSVVVVYQDAATRQRAMSVCDFLVKKFWSEIEFDFQWWRADFLTNARMAEDAGTNAAEADFVIICPSVESEISPALQAWFDTWIERRGGREGALVVDFTEEDVAQTPSVQRKIRFLEGVARRAGMDYLSCVPLPVANSLPDSFEAATLRAEEITSVLDDILSRVPPPSHFGLNE